MATVAAKTEVEKLLYLFAYSVANSELDDVLFRMYNTTVLQLFAFVYRERINSLGVEGMVPPHEEEGGSAARGGRRFCCTRRKEVLLREEEGGSAAPRASAAYTTKS